MTFLILPPQLAYIGQLLILATFPLAVAGTLDQALVGETAKPIAGLVLLTVLGGVIFTLLSWASRPNTDDYREAAAQRAANIYDCLIAPYQQPSESRRRIVSPGLGGELLPLTDAGPGPSIDARFQAAGALLLFVEAAVLVGADGLAALLGSALVGGIAVGLYRRMARAKGQRSETLGRFSAMRQRRFFEFIEGIEAVKGLGAQTLVLRQLNRLLSLERHDFVRLETLEALLWSVMSRAPFITFGLAIALLLGFAPDLALGAISGGAFAMAFAVFQMIQAVAHHRHQQQLLPVEVMKDEGDADGLMELYGACDSIALDRVRIDHGLSEVPLAASVSLDVAFGEIVVVEPDHDAWATATADILAGHRAPPVGDLSHHYPDKGWVAVTHPESYCLYVERMPTITDASYLDQLTALGSLPLDGPLRSYIDELELDALTGPAGERLLATSWVGTSVPLGLVRRILMARSLALKARFLIIDQPSAGLTPAQMTNLRSILNRERHDRGVVLFDTGARFAGIADRHLRLSADGVTDLSSQATVKK